ncbi:MAG TPA: hypothetical protein VM597_16520 [Gemmataceae bacterium]|nr:hypothetical protein [Gemmataceae bacterium]
MSERIPPTPSARVGRAFGRATLLAAVLVAGYMFATTYRDMFQSGTTAPADDPPPVSPLVAPGDWSFGFPGWELAYRVTTAEEWAKPDDSLVPPTGPVTEPEAQLLKLALALGKPHRVGDVKVVEGPLGGATWARARVVRHNGEDRLVHAAAAWKADGDRLAVLEIRPAAGRAAPSMTGLLPMPAGVPVLATRSAADGRPHLQVIGPITDGAVVAAHWAAAGWERSALESGSDGALSPMAVYRQGSTSVGVMSWGGPKGSGTYYVLAPR